MKTNKLQKVTDGKETIGIYLPKVTADNLRTLAKSEHRSLSGLVNVILDSFLKQQPVNRP